MLNIIYENCRHNLKLGVTLSSSRIYFSPERWLQYREIILILSEIELIASWLSVFMRVGLFLAHHYSQGVILWGHNKKSEKFTKDLLLLRSWTLILSFGPVRMLKVLSSSKPQPPLQVSKFQLLGRERQLKLLAFFFWHWLSKISPI